MENIVIPTVQMTGMHIIPAEYRVARRWKATRIIHVGYRAVHRWKAIRTIPAEYQVVRRLEITAMEDMTKVADITEIVEIAGGITGLVMVAAIIEGVGTRTSTDDQEMKD